MKNKTIIITGASKGLGHSLACRWAGENTIINLSRTSSGDVTKKIEHFPCDLADTKSISEAFEKVSKKHKKVDLLINNAGCLVSAPVAIMDPKDISRMIATNLTAPILLSRLVFRKMMKQQSGQIINIVSMAPKLNIIGDSVYSATKSGLETFSKFLNAEGHKFGIHVNNIGVSMLEKGMKENLLDNEKQKIVNLIPHKQAAKIEDIGLIVEFFVLNSRDIGGQTVYLGGI